jgi:hypothetical protein
MVAITATDNLDGFILSHGNASSEYVSLAERPQGKRPDLLTFDGAVAFTITGMEVGRSTAGNVKVTVIGTVVDEGSVDNGKRLTKHIPLEGENSRNEPNVWQYYGLLESVGVAIDTIRSLTGKTEDFAKSYQEIIGRTAYGFAKASQYQDHDPSSGVVSFILQAKYDKEMAAGTRRANAWTNSGTNGNIAAATVATSVAPTTGSTTTSVSL